MEKCSGIARGIYTGFFGRFSQKLNKHSERICEGLSKWTSGEIRRRSEDCPGMKKKLQ